MMVQNFERGTLKYQAYITLDGSKIVTQEVCRLSPSTVAIAFNTRFLRDCTDRDYNAALEHLKSSHLAKFIQKCAEEDLLDGGIGGIETQILQPLLGFASRDELREI